MAESRQARRGASALAPRPARSEADLRELAAAHPQPARPRAPDGPSDADNPVVTGPSDLPDDVRGAPARAALGDRRPSSASSTTSGPRRSRARCSRCTAGWGATLARALCQLALDRNADAFEEIRPPTLVTTETLTATGQLPKFADDAYHLERDDLWCIPTAEVPLTSLARDEILDEADLPMRLMAYTPCYRREAGSAGRDTRGLLRVHEFDKVEIFAYATPEQAPALLDEMLGAGRGADRRARPRRIASSRSAPATSARCHHRSFDIEVYAPGVDQWLEVSSVLVQRLPGPAGQRPLPPVGEKGTEIVHTLNGSALAVPRVWAAVVENNRQGDGTSPCPGSCGRDLWVHTVSAPVGAGLQLNGGVHGLVADWWSDEPLGQSPVRRRMRSHCGVAGWGSSAAGRRKGRGSRAPYPFVVVAADGAQPQGRGRLGDWGAGTASSLQPGSAKAQQLVRGHAVTLGCQAALPGQLCDPLWSWWLEV